MIIPIIKSVFDNGARLDNGRVMEFLATALLYPPREWTLQSNKSSRRWRRSDAVKRMPKWVHLLNTVSAHTTPAGMVMLSDPQSTANSNILKSFASRESIDEESAPIGITEIKSPALPVGRSLVRPPHR